MNDSFEKFVMIMKTLLSENGCPWDKAQTHESLKVCMLEESYEVVDAINKNDMPNLCEELGDVMLQVVFHSLLAEKEGEFTLDDTINGISDKMIFRHPHIFGNDNADTSEEVLSKWEDIKKKEKGYVTKSDAMKAVASAMPALIRGQKIIKKSGVCKDKQSENIDKIIDFAIENLIQLKMEKDVNKTGLEAKIGNVLMTILNISNFFQINAEFSLTNALKTYITRFEDFESMSATVAKTTDNTGLGEADIFINLLKGCDLPTTKKEDN